jgi:hypothetical protein
MTEFLICRSSNKNFHVAQFLRMTFSILLRQPLFLFVIVLLSIPSCSSNKYSQSDVDKYFTKERATAKTSPISFRIPQGWHVVDANNKSFIDLWIVRDDLNVSLSLLPFHSNSTANTLEKNLDSSIMLTKTKYKNKVTTLKEKPIRLNGKLVLPYSFSVDAKNYRVVLFEHNNKFYELTLFGNNVNIKIEYFIQELVILSAK